HRLIHAQDRRMLFVHSTERTEMVLACAIDHQIETDCPHQYSSEHSQDSGHVAFTIAAQAGHPIHLTKYMTYHTSKTASPEEIACTAEWTLDRVVGRGFSTLLAEQQEYMDCFWQRSDVQVSNIEAERARLSTVEMQQAIRINLFHILQ